MPGTDLLQVQRAFSPVNPTTRLGIPRVGETLPGQHGVMCEPARVNLLPNPSAKVDTTNILTVNAGAALARDATIGLQTGTSVKVTCDGTVASQGAFFQTVAPQGAGTYVGSAWVYSRAGGEQVTIKSRGTPITGAIIEGAQNYTLKAGWQRLVSPAFVVPQGTSIYLFQVFVRTTATAAITFWMTDGQLEHGLGLSSSDVFPTSFIDGSSSPASAYSWDASPATPVLTNGSFESGLTGWTAENGMAITAVATQHFIGANSCQISAGGGGDMYQITTGGSAAPGQIWTLSGAFLIPSTMSGTPKINIQAFSATTSLQTWSLNLPTAGNASWQTFAITSDALPAGTTRIAVGINGGATGDPAWYIDAMQLEHRSYATTFANPGTALGSSASRAETQLGYNLPAPITTAWSMMGWTKLGYTPSATTSQRIIAYCGSVYVAINGANLFAWDGVNAITLNPATPLAAGDVIAFLVSVDPVGKTSQLWLYHNGVIQSVGPLSNTAAVTSASALFASYVTTAPDSAPAYGGESFVGPLALFTGLLSANDIQRYIDLGTFDPTRDPRIQTVLGYGSEQQGLMFWQAGVSASGGVVQAIGSYTGQIYKDDGQGNALAYNQRRFALLLAENPNYNGLTIGQQIALNAIDGSIELVDVWTVTSLHSSDPSQVDIICTHS